MPYPWSFLFFLGDFAQKITNKVIKSKVIKDAKIKCVENGILCPEAKKTIHVNPEVSIHNTIIPIAIRLNIIDVVKLIWCPFSQLFVM